MRLTLNLDGQRQEISLQRWRASTTLAEFISAAGGPALADDEQLFIDASPVAAATPLSEAVLLEGSTISRTPLQLPDRVTDWSVTLSGSQNAGEVVTIPRKRKMLLGRSPQADVVLPTESASWNHFSLEREEDGIRVRDEGSTNGTLVAGEKLDAEGVLVTDPTTIIAGGATILVRPSIDEPLAPAPGSLHNVTPAGTAPFNRPPRPVETEDQEPLAVPARKEVPQASKFSFITVLAPLAIAVAMVIMLRDARYAMFAMLSPVMAVGVWAEQKRRRKKGLKEEAERFDKELAGFKADIAKATVQEAKNRRARTPDVATMMRRPARPTTALWQLRPDSKDFLALNVGTGNEPWQPEVDSSNLSRLDETVKEALNSSSMPSGPVTADLNDAGVVGIVGERAGALALARSLVIQAAIQSGPADLTIAVFCENGREDTWEWASWLPHTKQMGVAADQRWMSHERHSSTVMLRSLRESVDELPTPAMLLVLDSEVLTEGRDAPARDLLGHGRPKTDNDFRHKEHRKVSGIVIATSEEQLPASCTSVVIVGADSEAAVKNLSAGTVVEEVVISGISEDNAARTAAALAHFEDPELSTPGASLPALVKMPALLDYSVSSAEHILSLWKARTGISTPIGVGESGTLALDLVKDGPHGLVGGTTGSGKSEFLRSLVAGLAARNDPTTLNFILIDFKGGAAFRSAERLPHTIGTISNLDEQLADRALRSLEAEMERRQRVFAQAGPDIDNLPAYLATNPAEPMPRLLLVVDEFAMLAKDFPEVLTALVNIGAVGRTLGVHMILATQRPAGVVNDDILANTNMRVALRVQSRDDSSNVIGVPDAAGIGRAQMGRAYVKLGHDDITPVQTALVTGPVVQEAEAPVEVADVGRFGQILANPAPRKISDSDATDLDQLIDAIVAANEDLGIAPPRQVWPEALSARVNLAGFSAPSGLEVGGMVDGVAQVALADEPDLQRQSPAGWNLADGNLALIGLPGSGTSTTLSSIALDLALNVPPEELDIITLDMGSGELAHLADLPHSTAYVGSGHGAHEQQARFLRYVNKDLRRRRNDGSYRKPLLVLIDGLATLRDEFDDYHGQELLDTLYRAYADGPALGMHFALTTTRSRAIPSAIDEITTQKWLFRLADRYDYTTLGLTQKQFPAPVPGRCVSAVTKLQMHIATPDRPVAEAVELVQQAWPDAAAKRNVIGQLPDDVTFSELGAKAEFGAEPWRVPVGLREEDLEPAVIELYEGEHMLIAGTARSGKSTLLLAIAEAFRASEENPAIWGICDKRSPLMDAPLDQLASNAEDIPAMLAQLRIQKRPVVLLIDDAQRIEDPDKSISSILSAGKHKVLVIASARSSDLHTMYSHWTRDLRKSRVGVLLQPDLDVDGDLLSTKIPRVTPVPMTVGRGWACGGGGYAFIQAMSPSNQPAVAQ